jgi:hypothetical protein
MHFKYSKSIILIYFFFFIIKINSQNPSALYQNWLDAQTNNTTPTLPTFSYAGYHNGEISLPSAFSQQVYDVTNSPFNAVANDNKSDKEAIKAAIAAAEANPNGGIIFFPPGRFIVNDANPTIAGVAADDPSEVIRISKSNIVIKGSGSGVGGTELYQKSHTTHPSMATSDWSCPYLFLFWNGEDSLNSFVTTVTANANREAYTIQVANTSNISEGQWVELYVKNNNAAFVAEELAPFSTSDFYQPENLKIVNNGVEVREVHKVVSKTVNTITFKEPIHRAINASYNWQINSFRALEEVGVQDLKYTGGFIYNHIHHKAPEELYPNEAVSGPHAFLSSSGWSGIQFNHTVNSWISNVEFSAMSQAAQFVFTSNATALNNKYTGNPGHNFISTNSASGCFLGRNNDHTTGVWHGSGVNAKSIGNVLWRNEHPNDGSSGIEVHASQPRSTLIDVCKGGIFFNQGGSTGALPNHLKNMVLWNFEGVSYQNTNVKTFRPNSETKYAKFITPIISGLKGFTMSSEPNQFQVNESPGKHVDEESLYESQLQYRLGTLPNWISNTGDFSVHISSTFLALNTGNSSQLSATVSPNNGNNQSVTWSSSNAEVAIVDANGNVTGISPGFAIISVTDSNAISIATCYVNINNVAINSVVTVSGEQDPNFGANAVDGDFETRWSAENFPQWLELDFGTSREIFKSEVIAHNDRSYQYLIETKENSGDAYVQIVDRSSHIDMGSIANPITDTFTSINARYVRITVSDADVYDGEWTSILEFRVYATENSLSLNTLKLNKTKVYPNPFSSEIKIGNLEAKFEKAVLFDILGRAVVNKNLKGLDYVNLDISANKFSIGIYFLRLIGANISEEYKLIKK